MFTKLARSDGGSIWVNGHRLLSFEESDAGGTVIRMNDGAQIEVTDSPAAVAKAFKDADAPPAARPRAALLTPALAARGFRRGGLNCLCSRCGRGQAFHQQGRQYLCRTCALAVR